MTSVKIGLQSTISALFMANNCTEMMKMNFEAWLKNEDCFDQFFATAKQMAVTLA